MTIWTSSRRSQHSAPRRSSASPVCRPSGRRQRGSPAGRYAAAQSAQRPAGVRPLQIAVRYRAGRRGGAGRRGLVRRVPARDGGTLLAIGDVVGHDTGLLPRWARSGTCCAASPTHRRTPAAVSPSSTARSRSGPGSRHRGARPGGPPGPDEDTGAPTLQLRWSNAGHPPPLLINPDGTAELLAASRSCCSGWHPRPVRGDHTSRHPAGCHGAALHRRAGRASGWDRGGRPRLAGRGLRGSVAYRSGTSATSCLVRSRARPRTTSPCSPFEPARGAASRGDRGGGAPVPPRPGAAAGVA